MDTPKQAPRTRELLQDIKASFADKDGVAAFCVVNTGFAGAYELVLPAGGVARWEADGVSFDFAGRTPQQVAQGLNQLANLLHDAAAAYRGLKGLCMAYEAAASQHAKDTPILAASKADIRRIAGQ